MSTAYVSDSHPMIPFTLVETTSLPSRVLLEINNTGLNSSSRPRPKGTDGWPKDMDYQAHSPFNFHDLTFDQIMISMTSDPINSSYQQQPSSNQGGFNNVEMEAFDQDIHGFCPAPGDMFDFNTTSISDPDPIASVLQQHYAGEEAEENTNYGDDSSATTMMRTNVHSSDRARTLISERRRRGRMKEKLYALRSLVPNISKMDKASIVGDAVSYVQDLQKQVRQLKAEIAGLEQSSPKAGCQGFQGSFQQIQVAGISRSKKNMTLRKVFQMDVYRVEEGGFYVRLVCNEGEGMVVALYKALESLTNFHLQSSNFSTLPGRFVLTFTLNIRECSEETDESAVKLWVMGALLNQGFELKAAFT